MSKKELLHEVPIIANNKLDAQTAIITLDAPTIAKAAEPGQFVQLSTSQFLRRPISIMSVDREQGTVELGIRAVGIGTRELIGLKIKEMVSVMGPLGHGFSFEKIKELIVVGGGIGIFPLVMVLEEAKRLAIPTTLICGFRSEQEAMLLERLRNLAHRCVFSSDTGGLDFHGHAAAALTQEISSRREVGEGVFAKNTTDANMHSSIHLITCGPIPLLRAVATIASDNKIPCDVSLESRMACGIGVCLGCAIPIIDESNGVAYERCCHEGPVFKASRVAWSSMSGIV